MSAPEGFDWRLYEARQTALLLGLSGTIVVSREYGGSTVEYYGEITIPKVPLINTKRFQPLINSRPTSGSEEAGGKTWMGPPGHGS